MAVSALRSAIINALGGTVESPVAASEQKMSLAEPTAEMLSLLGALPSAAGVSVSPETAMKCAPVRAAILAISEAVGQLPLHVYQRTDEGKERDRSHPVAKLINDTCNPWSTSAQFRETLTIDALTHGNGFGEIVRVGEGRAFELHRLDPRAVTILQADDGGPVYRVSGPGKSTRLVARGDMLHIVAPGGRSPISDAREAIGVALRLEQHAASLFGNGARPSGVVSLTGSPTPGAIEKMGAAWKAAFGRGGSNVGGVAVLDGGAEFKPLTFSSVDAQFLECWNNAVLEIASIFRVPPTMIQRYDRATWKNSEEMAKYFLTYSLTPWLKRWEGEVRLKLFSVEDRDNYVVEFLTDDLLRSDYATRTEGYSKLIAARVLNPNEVRAMENLPPYEGGDEFANPAITTGAPGTSDNLSDLEGSTDA